VADKYGWTKISCVEGKRMRSKEDIFNDIYLETVDKL